MAKITLSKLKHSYMPNPLGPADYALKEIDVTWRDGGAYALLGPSGCGKSTLLNIISGLLIPSEGRILFGETDVTGLPPDARNIAQVFQFPVIYDTMTVRQNLAFPLKNRGVDASTIDRRVAEIAEMLDVTEMLDMRAAGLSPDNKQKISMGRGLVRDDVNVVMFDEPLTVIDPHLKWKLRSKLKELHQRVRATMIYVTHDQTEAMTLADEIALMQDGAIEQMAPPRELYNKSESVFGGWFLGNPGMNFVPVKGNEADAALIAGVSLVDAVTTIGFRPEDVTIESSETAPGMDAVVEHIAVVTGGQRLVNLRSGDMRLKAKGRWMDAAFDTMLVSNRAAADAFINHGANACTDVTGFGLAGHLAEMLAADDVGAKLELDALPVMEGAVNCLQQNIFSSLHADNHRISEIMEIAAAVSKSPLFELLFDPQTAGGLLASVPAVEADKCITELENKGYSEARTIGKVTERSEDSPVIQVN